MEALMSFGIQGPKGDTGAMGARGPQGPQGPSGTGGVSRCTLTSAFINTNMTASKVYFMLVYEANTFKLCLLRGSTVYGYFAGSSGTAPVTFNSTPPSKYNYLTISINSSGTLSVTSSNSSALTSIYGQCLIFQSS